MSIILYASTDKLSCESTIENNMTRKCGRYILIIIIVTEFE